MHRYTRSQQYLARAQRVIPNGNQTFSKGPATYPYGASPFFVTHGQGSHVWDVDGNEYIDFVCGLATITLGHDDPDVTAAVQEQLKGGVLFSLPHPIETAVAELIIEMVPCAEMVRFSKTGSDVTTAAIRLARAYTNRDHIATCGYHGWQDWSIGVTARNLGVPKATRELTHTFEYNDIDSLRNLFDRYPGQIAAVILEPMHSTDPEPGYLESVRAMSHDNGTLLIFDEMVTGFRFAKGGAQECFSVIPDLATFGKGLANGYPLSAIAGSKKVMMLMDDIFFSVTYGGETLSLSAALATLRKLANQPVIRTLRETGQELKTGIQRRIEEHHVENILDISGHPSWTFILFRDVGGYTEWQIRTLFLQEMLARGILTFGMHFTSYSHSEADIRRLLSVYDEVLPILRDAIENRSLEERLQCETLHPLFKIR